MTIFRHMGIIYPWRISELDPLVFVVSVGSIHNHGHYITSSPALSNRQGGLIFLPIFLGTDPHF